MIVLFWVILTTLFVGLISLAGALILVLKDEVLNKVVGFLVDLSIGVLMAVAFLDLLPDTLEEFGGKNIFLYILIGFFFFFLVEKILHWRHCHQAYCSVHTFAYINLLGEAVHNFTDGLIIGATFIVNFHLGIATVMAVILHEIPHEIGNFGVLIYAGFKKGKALLFNCLIGTTAILGGILGYYLSNFSGITANFLLPFAAGGFIYIAASDLIPEGKKEVNVRKSMMSFIVAVFGILLIFLLKNMVSE